MQKWEYAMLSEYFLYRERFGQDPQCVYFLHLESGESLLQSSWRLGALNEVGRNGWVVFETVQLGGPGAERLPERFIETLLPKYDWITAKPGSSAYISMRYLRRPIE